jgi:hypothetical protein
MSTKDFFNKSKAFVSNTNDKASYDLVESSRNVNSTREKETQYIPHVDFSDAGNFCFYGSAELYYKSAISRIYDFYPYDGSSDEKNKFFTNSFDIDKYFFDNLYPKTNGYVRLSGFVYHNQRVVRTPLRLPTQRVCLVRMAHRTRPYPTSIVKISTPLKALRAILATEQESQTYNHDLSSKGDNGRVLVKVG